MCEESDHRDKCAGEKEEAGNGLQWPVQIFVCDQVEVHPVAAPFRIAIGLALGTVGDQVDGETGVVYEDEEPEERVKRALSRRRIWLPLRARWRKIPAKRSSEP